MSTRKILILTLGTRGDVQPFVALARGLQRAGHEAVIATDAEFESFVRDHAIDFRPISGRFLQLARSDAGLQAIDAAGGRGSKLALLALLKQALPLLREMLQSIWDVAQDANANAIVYHPKTMAGAHLREKLSVPVFAGFGIPALSPTARFANPLITVRNLGSRLNRLSYRLFDLASTAPYRKLIGEWRRDVLGLKSASIAGSAAGSAMVPANMPKLYHYSTHVVPRPPDWDANNVVTGYWFLDRDDGWRPSHALMNFLDAGDAPVYVGFGSMPSRDAEAKTRLVVDAVRRTGKRAVIATGWGGLARGTAGEDIFVLDAAPHDWLFPRMSAVVHHGGAGTTAAGLRAGKPTVICPFFGDQPFWGERVRALGVGPPPIPQKSLTSERLAQAIDQATSDAAMRERAEALGAAIRREDGVGCAVETIVAQL